MTSNVAGGATAIAPRRDPQEKRPPMSKQHATRRRPRGTGSLRVVDGIWYGRWPVRGKPVERSLGPARQPGTRDGLTQGQADKKLRELMDATSTAPANTGKVTVEQAGERLLSQLRRKNRSKSHVETVES